MLGLGFCVFSKKTWKRTFHFITMAKTWCFIENLIVEGRLFVVWLPSHF